MVERGSGHAEREHTVRASAEDSQRSLTEFRSRVAQHIAAIQTAGREFLAQPADADDVGPREIRLEIGIGPDPKAARLQYDSVDCWDEDVICGKGRTGYLHCTVHVCMEIGPITVAP